MSSALEEKLSLVFRKVKRNFVFKEDAGLEQWDMPPARYDGRQLIRDDCDGFCLACRTLLRREHIPSRLVYCEVRQRNRLYGHLVVEVQGWILDNRQDRVVPNTRLHDYRWRFISGYEPGEAWREIVMPTMA